MGYKIVNCMSMHLCVCVCTCMCVCMHACSLRERERRQTTAGLVCSGFVLFLVKKQVEFNDQLYQFSIHDTGKMTMLYTVEIVFFLGGVVFHLTRTKEDVLGLKHKKRE